MNRMINGKRKQRANKGTNCSWFYKWLKRKTFKLRFECGLFVYGPSCRSLRTLCDLATKPSVECLVFGFFRQYSRWIIIEQSQQKCVRMKKCGRNLSHHLHKCPELISFASLFELSELEVKCHRNAGNEFRWPCSGRRLVYINVH